MLYNVNMSEDHTPINNDSVQQDIVGNPDINFFGMTNFRNQNRRFGIRTDDRRRHMYVVGKTGMGKTTILENMVLNDIYAGHGVGVVDPHGDFAEKIIDFIPPKRINDVVYFNPADIDYPIGFNILETIREDQKHLIASGLMNVFKKIWPDVWSARMEYILNNTILALIDFPGTTLLGINRMLADDEYRKRVVANSKDPVVKAFWLNEFANYSDKFRTEAVAPIQNKIGQFLSASVIRNIVAQVKSRINIREIMDTQKIFIMNLSKGRIGEDNSRLLGGMLVTKIQLAAMERVDISEKDRKDFFLYVDEFQNFATESFANILSEARKYRLDLIMAHQYMEQLEEEVLAAVIGNVGTMVTFRVGSSDAEILAKEFTPTFIEEDLVNLPKYHVYMKLMIDGVASRPFSALTLPPIAASTQSTDKVVRVSRERYAVERSKIEDKIARWSGMVIMNEETATSLEVDPDEEMFGDIPQKTPVPNKPTPANTVPALQRANPAPAPAPKPATPPPAVKAPSPAPAVRSVPPPAARPNPPAPVSNANTPKPFVNNGGNRPPQAPGAPGEGRKRKRRRGKRSGDGMAPSNSGGERVLLVDPNQKGMSLSSLQPEKLDLFDEPQPKPAAPQTPAPPAPVSTAPSSITTTVITTTTVSTPPVEKPVVPQSINQPPAPRTIPPNTPIAID